MVIPRRAGLRRWLRIRRHAVPPTMIARASIARESGDWRGACAAACVDVEFDLVDVRREYGRRAAAAIEEDLVHLAPDLLRWHLPRATDQTALSPFTSLVLDPSPRTRPGHASGAPVLVVWPPNAIKAPQRLRLRVARADELRSRPFYDVPRHLWDARRAGNLRQAWGGSAHRPPLLEADGTPVSGARLGTAPDRAAQTEQIMARLADGGHLEAWHDAGIELTLPRHGDHLLEQLSADATWPVGIAEEARRLTELYRGGEIALAHSARAVVVVTAADDGRVRGRLLGPTSPPKGRPMIMSAVGRLPADLELMWHGLMTPDEPHPLVRASLFPRLGPPAPRDPLRPHEVRVRCRGAWHRIRVVGARLTALDHDADDQGREQVLRALGGTSAGCAAALWAWTGGRARLPKELNRRRRDLFEGLFHGDAAGVLAMLDAGALDPGVRDGDGTTMLHMLAYVDDETLLPRMLAAGVPVDVRDRAQRTPLHAAATHGGSPTLVRALLRAGADPDAVDGVGLSVRDRARIARRADLRPVIDARYPDR